MIGAGIKPILEELLAHYCTNENTHDRKEKLLRDLLEEDIPILVDVVRVFDAALQTVSAYPIGDLEKVCIGMRRTASRALEDARKIMRRESKKEGILV